MSLSHQHRPAAPQSETPVVTGPMDQGPSNQSVLEECLAGGVETASMYGSLRGGSDSYLGELAGALGLGGEESEAAKNLEAARSEFSGKFVIGEGGGMKDGKAVLSPEAYEHMLQTYANIRGGTSHLKISPLGMDEAEAAEFKSAALDNLSTIMQTESGRELIDRVANQSSLDPEDRRDIVLSNGLRSLEESGDGLRPVGNRAVPRSTNNTPETEGTKTGSGVFWVNEDRDVVTPDGQTLPMPKDAVLFHELTHAMHNLEGTRPEGKVEGDHPDAGRAELEEHHTIGIGEYEGERISENAYREQRRNQLTDPAEKARYQRRESWNVTAPAWKNDHQGRKYGEGGWPE